MMVRFVTRKTKIVRHIRWWWSDRRVAVLIIHDTPVELDLFQGQCISVRYYGFSALLVLPDKMLHCQDDSRISVLNPL